MLHLGLSLFHKDLLLIQIPLRFFQRHLDTKQAVLQVFLLDGIRGRFELLAFELRALLHVILVQVGQVELDAQDEGLLLLELVLDQAHLLFLLLAELALLLSQSSLNVDPELAFLGQAGHGFLRLARQCIDLRLHMVDLSQEHLDVLLAKGGVVLENMLYTGPERRHLVLDVCDRRAFHLTLIDFNFPQR